MHGQKHIKSVYVCMYVSMEQLDSHWTDFYKTLYLCNFLKYVEKFEVSLKSDKNNCTLPEDQYTFLITFRSVLLRTKNVSDKSCREIQNTHFMFNNFFFFENRAIYEIRLNNIVVLGRPQMKIRRMCFACWITKATPTHTHTHTHTRNIKKNIVFRLQQPLRERTSISRYKNITCLELSNCNITFLSKPKFSAICTLVQNCLQFRSFDTGI